MVSQSVYNPNEAITRVGRKTMVAKMFAPLAIALLLWTTGSIGCSTVVGGGASERYNQNPLTVSIPPNVSAEQVQKAAEQVLRKRDWQVTSSSPQEIVGTLDHRSFKAKTILKVDNGLIKLLSDSKYEDESGRLLPGVPKGWLENLRKDLNKSLARAVR